MTAELDKRNAAYAYSIYLLKVLHDMELITDREYEKIREISARHYGIKK